MQRTSLAFEQVEQTIGGILHAAIPDKPLCIMTDLPLVAQPEKGPNSRERESRRLVGHGNSHGHRRAGCSVEGMPGWALPDQHEPSGFIALGCTREVPRAEPLAGRTHAAASDRGASGGGVFCEQTSPGTIPVPVHRWEKR